MSVVESVFTMDSLSESAYHNRQLEAIIITEFLAKRLNLQMHGGPLVCGFIYTY